MSEEEREVLKTFKKGLGLTSAEQEILVNYIDRLQKENETLKAIINKEHEVNLDKRYVELNFVSKDKIRETKEKIHWLLDKNGITRAYQLEVDRYLEDLLKENNNE